MNIDQLRSDIPNRITQVKQRVIRRLEDEAVIALMIGDSRAAVEIMAKIEALEAVSGALKDSDSEIAQRRMRRMFRRG